MIKIPGWTSDKELKILEAFASNVPDGGSILEIGPFIGRSTLALYNGKKDTVSLDIVDPFTISDWFTPEKNYTDFYGDSELFEKAKQIARETNSWEQSFRFCIGEEICNKINIFPVSSQEFTVTKNYDLIFIDGDHAFRSVSHDIKKFSNNHSLIIGDDFTNKFPGVVGSVLLFKGKKSIIIPCGTKFYIIAPTVDKQNWNEVIKKII